MSRPVGRVLSSRASRRCDGRPSIWDRRCRRPRAVYPRARAGRPRTLAQVRADRTLLTLLRVGFTEPRRSPGTLVVSYTTVSPLPRLRRWRSVLCGTFPRVTPGGSYPPPCPVEPGPSSTTCPPPRPPGQLIRPISVPPCAANDRSLQTEADAALGRVGACRRTSTSAPSGSGRSPRDATGASTAGSHHDLPLLWVLPADARPPSPGTSRRPGPAAARPRRGRARRARRCWRDASTRASSPAAPAAPPAPTRAPRVRRTARRTPRRRTGRRAGAAAPSRGSTSTRAPRAAAAPAGSPSNAT